MCFRFLPGIIQSLFSKLPNTPSSTENINIFRNRLVPLSLPPSDHFMPSIKFLHYYVFHALAGLNTRKDYGPDGVPLLFTKTVLPCLLLVKLFQLRLLLGVCLHSLCSKNSDRSDPSNYSPIALIPCLSISFNLFSIGRLDHLSLHSLLSDRHYGFRQGCCTSNLLAFLTEA